ncbi:MAG: multiheme c-type cytochrome, partial [Burkholderiaceae bacterium]
MKMNQHHFLFFKRRAVLRSGLLLFMLAVSLIIGLDLSPSIAIASDAKLPDRMYVIAPPAPKAQTEQQAAAKSAGCISCHTASDRHTMHANPAVVLGCTDCHGGNANVSRTVAGPESDVKHPAYRLAIDRAHIMPRDEKFWRYPSSANPERSYAKLNKEHPAYIRFINPGDLRVARDACGSCHLPIIQAQERSLMSTSAMLWGGASYNNGILPYKRYILGESYTPDGKAAQIVNPLRVDNELFKSKGILDHLFPLPAWESVPPADVFRVFERGGRVISSQFPEIGLPNSSGTLQKLDEPGRPDIHQSNRGPGTGSRIAVPAINITKTRLNDPHLWFLGTNDQAGDYRSSGCTACHSVYANDRDPKHAGPYATFGSGGNTATLDPTIPKNEPGHPIKHEFTRAIPSSQCMVCHMHQPNIFVNSFYGYTMWDYESDAPAMWPKKQKYPTDAEIRAIQSRNPEEAATRGNWGDPAFLKDVSKLNPTLKDTQFADYHGHGWNFRAIFKRDRKGALLDAKGNVINDDDPDKFKKTVHLSSIHMDKGMQCVDCHFAQDTHGNGHIYGEVAAAIEIDCVDCHGSAKKYPTLHTSGPAAAPGGMDMSLLKTQDGRQRFEWRDGKLYQRAALDPDKEWLVSLVKDSVNPYHPNYNEKAARAKLMAAGLDGQVGKWGPGVENLAHDNEKMTCYTCHLSWTTSCAGCHLPIQANWKTERLHYEGNESRNYASYNPQVVRDDMFQLGVAGPVKGSRITPVRSSSALVLSSVNSNRDKIYIQQPPIAASGFSSQAFAPHYPHTERKEETKTCSDCHVSKNNDNNAIMAQLLLQGTNFVNFVG